MSASLATRRAVATLLAAGTLVGAAAPTGTVTAG